MTQDPTGHKRLILHAALAQSVKAAIGTPQAGTFMISADELIKLAEDVTRDVEAAFRSGFLMSDTAGAEDTWEDAYWFYSEDVERPDVPT